MIVKEKNVHIGEVKIGSGDDTLNALLGSCVGIAILWPERDLYGLAHCLLAKSPNTDYEVGGRYVDQAIFSLLKLMNVTKEDCHKVRAVVAGGGNMTKPEDTEPEKLVGYHNTKQAIKTLSELKIKIIHEDTGGRNGRKITVECMTGKFDVKSIPRPIAA